MQTQQWPLLGVVVLLIFPFRSCHRPGVVFSRQPLVDHGQDFHLSVIFGLDTSLHCVCHFRHSNFARRVSNPQGLDLIRDPLNNALSLTAGYGHLWSASCRDLELSLPLASTYVFRKETDVAVWAAPYSPYTP